MSTQEQVELRRDAQVRQLRNGFVVTVQSRAVGAQTQKVHDTATEELIAATAMEATNILASFLMQDANAPQGEATEGESPAPAEPVAE